MRLIDLKTNEVIEQPADVGEKFLRAGTHTINENDDFFVFNPMEETTQRVSGKDLFGQLKLGRRLVPDETLDQELEAEAYDDADVRAGAISTIRALTGGLSDQLLVKTMGVKPETLDKLRKYNPYLETTAQIAAPIATLAMPALAATRIGQAAKLGSLATASKFTAPSAIARIGNSVESAAAKALTALSPVKRGAIAEKILQYAPKVLGGTVEGAFYGTGQLVTEEALGNPELLGESLFAKGLEFAGEGALAGGVLTAGGLGLLAAAKGAIDGVYKITPGAVKTFLGVDKDITLAYLDDPLRYDETEFTKEFIAKKASTLAKQTINRYEKGLVDLDDVKREIQYKVDTAKREKSDSIYVYQRLKDNIDNFVNEERASIKEMEPPAELVTEIIEGKKSLKQRIVEDDEIIDEMLLGIDPTTSVTKTSNLLNKLKQLRRDTFKPSLTERGEFVTRSLDEEESLKMMNRYIDMTKKYSDSGYDTLNLKDMRDYLKTIRKDIDFIGKSEFHADKINQILNIYQDYVSNAIKQKAPDEFFVVMENMRRNVEMMSVLNKSLKDEEKVQRFLFNSYKKTPSNNYIREYLENLDTEIGTSIIPKMDQYGALVSAARKGTPEFIDSIRAQHPDLAQMIEEGAYLEGMKRYPMEAAQKRALDDSVQEIAQEYPPQVGAMMSPLSGMKPTDFDIINRNKGALGTDIDSLLNKVTDYLSKQVEVEQLGKKRYDIKKSVAIEKEKADALEAYEDFNEALKKIEGTARGNATKIKAAFAKASELSDTDFVYMMDTLRVNQAFENTFTRGSRNVDMWRVLLGSSLATPFVGPILGVLSGGLIDAFGPSIAKGILRAISKTKGSVTGKTFYKIISDEVPSFATAANKVHAKATGTIEDAAIEIQDSISKTPTQYFRRSMTPVYIKSNRDEGDTYEENAEKVKNWIETQDVILENFYQDNELLYRAAPQTTSAYLKTYQRAIQFLDSKNPRGINDYFGDHEPSYAAKYQFNRYVSFIENPKSVLEDMQKGFIPSDGVEVLRQVYPTIYESVLDQFNDALLDGKLKGLTLNQRLEIKTKLGLDLAPNFTPQTFAAIQQNNSAAEATSKLKSDIEERTQTDMVRLRSKA